MGWLIALGVLTVLAVIPLGVDVRYDEDGLAAKAVLWKLTLPIYPPKPKKKKKEGPGKPEEKTEEEPLPKPPEPPKRPKEQKKGGSLADFMPFVKLGLDFLNSLRRKLRLEILEVKLTLAGGDPADLAINYGKTWAAVGNLLPALEKWLVIGRRDVQVQCDFTADQTLILAHGRLTITLGRVLALAGVYGIRAFSEFLKFKNKGKGGRKL